MPQLNNVLLNNLAYTFSETKIAKNKRFFVFFYFIKIKYFVFNVRRSLRIRWITLLQSFSFSLSVQNMNSGKWNGETVNFGTEMLF